MLLICSKLVFAVCNCNAHSASTTLEAQPFSPAQAAMLRTCIGTAIATYTAGFRNSGYLIGVLIIRAIFGVPNIYYPGYPAIAGVFLGCRRTLARTPLHCHSVMGDIAALEMTTPVMPTT